ncbi:MAG TPA: ABC transporter ATP-binding protein [Usitatibacter sp.]|nr:ABC transporter ATP-binding protein [Usitatibacter sp.]
MDPSPSPLLQAENVSFRWAPRLAPTVELDRFTIAAQERVFLYGPSGSGKSTLLGIFGGVLVPQQGHVRILGTDLGSLGASRRDAFRVDHIGFIFQQFNLIPYLSVVENVLLPCRFSRRRRERAMQAGGNLEAQALRLLAQLDLGRALHARNVTQLSVGQQQRVAAARALIGRPELIIADEPTSSLDAGRQEGFLELLLAECASSGAALLFVSHDRRLAAHFTRQVAMDEVSRAAPALGEAA